MRIYGLTGNLASGKSTVAKLLAARGVPVVDADQVSRDVVAPGTPGLAAVAARFPGVVGRNGELDRKRLGALVFADEAERKALEQLLHPLIAAETMRRMGKLGEEGHAFAVYEAALIVEMRLHSLQDGLIVVTAPLERVLQRVKTRDGLRPEEALARLAAQLPQEEKAKAADFVVTNDGDLSALDAQVDALLVKLRAGYQRPR